MKFIDPPASVKSAPAATEEGGESGSLKIEGVHPKKSYGATYYADIGKPAIRPDKCGNPGWRCE
jgi:hypothetical protein